MTIEQGTLRRTIVAAAVYIAIMAVGMFVSGHVFHIEYSAKMVTVLVYVEIVLCLFALIVARRIFGRWDCGFGPIDWRGALWIVPNFALMAVMFAVVLRSDGAHWSGLVTLMIVTTIMVGFSEELMFRGILLQGARREVSLGKAILISSVGFSLLHSVNTLAGVPFDGMVQQMGLTFVFGLAMACYALRANSLVPVIVFHTLWDMVQFVGGEFGSDFGQLINIGIVLNATVAAVLWVVDLRKRQLGAA
jgi:membrane protease YdiL (CAAX protease family)